MKQDELPILPRYHVFVFTATGRVRWVRSAEFIAPAHCSGYALAPQSWAARARRLEDFGAQRADAVMRQLRQVYPAVGTVRKP